MWNCPFCGTENQGKFCSECGKEKSLRAQETIRVKKVDTANFDGGVTVNYKVTPTEIDKEDKISEKKKTNVLAVAGISVVVTVVVIILGLFGYYFSAKSDLSGGRYEAAEKKFGSVSFFLDSGRMEKKCIYEHAKALYEDGAYESAKEKFLKVSDFEDSEKLIFECEYKLLLAYKESGDFESVAKLIADIPEGRIAGRKEDIAEIESWCNYAYAKIIIEKDPEEARALLEEIDSDYEDTKDLILECSYLLAKKYEAEGKFSQALEEFKKCIDYKDSEYLLDLLESGILSNAIAVYGNKEYDECRKLIEMCEGLSEEEEEKASAYKLFLSYRTDIYQRPTVNSRLFSYLGSYIEARNIVLEDENVFSDFISGAWREDGVVMFNISDEFEIIESDNGRFPLGKCKYESEEIMVESLNGTERILYNIEIINNNKIKVNFANDSSEHILTRL